VAYQGIKTHKAWFLFRFKGLTRIRPKKSTLRYRYDQILFPLSYHYTYHSTFSSHHLHISFLSSIIISLVHTIYHPAHEKSICYCQHLIPTAPTNRFNSSCSPTRIIEKCQQCINPPLSDPHVPLPIPLPPVPALHPAPMLRHAPIPPAHTSTHAATMTMTTKSKPSYS